MKEFLQKLIQTETTLETGELAAARVIADRLAHSGIESAVDTWDKNRANITARIASSGEKPAILFACHLDVVPAGQGSWKYSPFSGFETKGRLHGRGATDMKGGIAAIVTAIAELADSGISLKGDVIFTATAGEETDSCGAARFVADYADELPQLAGIVIPEPTNFDIVTAHRGIFWLQVATYGKTAHGSMPQLGINAITAMKAVLDELVDYKINIAPHKLLGPSSMTINTIAGGKAVNVVPDYCSISMDIRTLPNQDTGLIIDDIKAIFARVKKKDPDFKADVSILRQCSALETDTDCDFVRQFRSACGIAETKAVGYTTDGPTFARLNAPVVIFGPGNTELCHKPDEYIDLSDVEKAVQYYKKIIRDFLT